MKKTPTFGRQLSLKRQASIIREQRGVGYIFLTMLGAVLIASSNCLRSMASETDPYDSYYALTVGQLICSALLLAFFRIVRSRDFRLPYYKRKPVKETKVNAVDTDGKATSGATKDGELTWQFDRTNLLLVILGGMLEFSVSLTINIGFGFAFQYGINAGIALLLLPLCSVFIGIVSYFAFEEHMQKVQVLGMIIILAGVTIISLFPAQSNEGKTATLGEFAIVLGINLLTTILFAAELITARVLSERVANSTLTGFSFIFALGVVGTVCFIIATAMGNGLHTIGWGVMGLMILAAFLNVLSIGLVQYTMSVGVGAVVSSIFTLNPAILVSLAYIFLDQKLSVMQVVGILISVLGALCLSIKDDLFCKVARCCKRKGKVASI